MYFIRKALLLFTLFTCRSAFGQDISFYVTDHYLSGQRILKVYKNIASSYVWVLRSDNQILRINSQTKIVDDLTSEFSQFSAFPFIDIVSPDDNTVFIVLISHWL